MVLYDSIAEVMDVKVGIYLGGEYAFVPEHLLHHPQISPVLDQVSRK